MDNDWGNRSFESSKNSPKEKRDLTKIVQNCKRPVKRSIHCRTKAGKNPWYEFACVASIISCKRGGCLKIRERKSLNFFSFLFFHFAVRSRWMIDVKVFNADALMSWRQEKQSYFYSLSFPTELTVNVGSRTFKTSTNSSIKPSYKTLFASCIADE